MAIDKNNAEVKKIYKEFFCEVKDFKMKKVKEKFL